MRKILKITFAIITAIAVFWITAPDVVIRLFRPLPENSLQLTITRQVQHVHFSHEATGLAWLVWIAVMLIGWRMKKWGKKQVQVGVPAGLLGALPLLPIVNMTGASAADISRHWDWLPALALAGAALVFAAKFLIWRYWWKLAVGRQEKP